jgi:hypothetical protein
MYYGRRRHERRSAFPLGMAPLGKIFIKQAFIRTCTLWDISRGGACLQVHHSSDIPEVFELVLDGLNMKKICVSFGATRTRSVLSLTPILTSGELSTTGESKAACYGSSIS